MGHKELTMIKRKFVIITVIILALLLTCCDRTNLSETENETINKTENGDSKDMKILAYSLSANCHLVYDEKSKKACLIDAPEYNDEIMEAITSNELSLEYIILTHGHFDHILGANAFREKTGAKIVVHELDTEYLEDPEKSMTSRYGGETVSADITVKDNDILTFGNISLRVVHTPGHTKGSSCFVYEEEKIMFSGDTLFKGTIGRYDFYGGDYNTLMDSLRKLKSFNKKYTIYPGHGDKTMLDDEVIGNPYLG